MHLPIPVIAVLAVLASSINAAAFPPNLNGADLTKVEICALHCLADGFHASDCRTEDLQCLCKSQAFVDKVKNCAKRSCRAHHYEWTKEAMTGECKKAGVNICLVDDVAVSDCDPKWNPFSEPDCRKRKFGVGRFGCVPPPSLGRRGEWMRWAMVLLRG